MVKNRGLGYDAIVEEAQDWTGAGKKTQKGGRRLLHNPTNLGGAWRDMQQA